MWKMKKTTTIMIKLSNKGRHYLIMSSAVYTNLPEDIATYPSEGVGVLQDLVEHPQQSSNAFVCFDICYDAITSVVSVIISSTCW